MSEVILIKAFLGMSIFIQIIIACHERLNLLNPLDVKVTLRYKMTASDYHVFGDRVLLCSKD